MLAIVFPGQGSQSVGMMAAFEGLPAIADTLAEASATLGYDMAALIAAGPTEALAKTVVTQPIMLTADVAVWRAYRALGGAAPAWLAGHSLGEYAALVAAESLTFAAALKLVHLRATAMQAAVPEGVGGIAAIVGLTVEQVAAVCQAASSAQEQVSLANLNEPKQTVISGHRPAVERALVLAKDQGAKIATLLAMSVPAHSALMRPAGEQLAVALASAAITLPNIPVLHNVNVACAANITELRAALAAQVAGSVRWAETVEALAAHGVTRIAEFGPGKVLTGLAKKIAPGVEAVAVNSRAQLEALLALP